MAKNGYSDEIRASKARQARIDIFGNEIDPEVGYARGSILRSSLDETRRIKHCQEITANRIALYGKDSVGVFTGSRRAFPILSDDQDTICEEWIGPSLHGNLIKEVALSHLGGRPTDSIAFFNRTSAGIIATVAALSSARPVVSIVPIKGRSHASVVRGCTLAGVPLLEADDEQNWRNDIDQYKPKLIIITTVTSKLEVLDDSLIEEITEFGHKSGAWVLLDEAYGARLRPALLAGRPSLAFNADLTITNCDKSGLQGPRAGLMAGNSVLIDRIQARAFELGMEARSPIIAAAFRALQHYRPEHLVAEAENGKALTEALKTALPQMDISHTALGPLLTEESILHEMLRIARLPSKGTSIVPCEATTALGVLLLRDHGILTTNTHGQPGASVTLRLKPTSGSLERVGGIDGVAQAVCQSINSAALLLDKPADLRALFFGAP